MDRRNNNNCNNNNTSSSSSSANGKLGTNNNSSNNTSNDTTNTSHGTRPHTNTDRTPENTSWKITAETPRNPSQQTPKTPTSARTKTTPTSRGATPTSAMLSPHPANTSRGVGERTSTTNTQSKRDESDSTTPAYPDSSTLLNRSTSNAKIQLSDIQPVETKVVERIKNLEISIEQHRASHDQLEQFIQSLQQELKTVKEKHEAAVEVADARMRELKSAMDQLQETSLANSGRLQELWELVRQLSENLANKESQLNEIQNSIEELKQLREEILQDREDTQRIPLERTRMEKAKLLVEYEEIQKIEQSCLEIMEELQKSFSPEEIEIKQAQVMANDDRIAHLESLIAENKSSVMIDERNADELVLMFDKVYERRIQSHAHELEAIEQQALELEKHRDQEANATLEEYISLNQLSVEAEENASREEFNLLAEREKLAELESSLEALKLELSQRQETATV